MPTPAAPARDNDNRDRHGFRGTPPPPTFSLADLPDDALLTEFETASVGRWSTNTVGRWRQQPGHPLEWELVAGKYVRYRVGNVKRFMAAGPRRTPKSRPPQSSRSGATHQQAVD